MKLQLKIFFSAQHTHTHCGAIKRIEIYNSKKKKTPPYLFI